MTQLDENTVKKLAGLSRIAVTPEEEVSLLKDLKKILGYIEQLDEVDTSNIQPCTYVTKLLSQSPLREDVVEPTLTRDAFMKGAPSQISGMIRVPPVLKPES
jgi:aspartyl-tRNA(Asn)/glutamyl-tRNA(Gln) amidotransferase subunit C